MALEIVWLEQAYDDLESVFDYIHVEDPNAAATYVEQILDACGRLSEFPLSGRQYDGRYRLIVVRNHLIFYGYQPGDLRVRISAVIDGRRDIAAVLAKR